MINKLSYLSYRKSFHQVLTDCVLIKFINKIKCVLINLLSMINQYHYQFLLFGVGNDAKNSIKHWKRKIGY